MPAASLRKGGTDSTGAFVLTPHHLFFATGAPGAGKSTVCSAVSDHNPLGIAAFDIDHLLLSASDLTGTDLRVDLNRWPAYNALWVSILEAVSCNGILPMLFCPLTRSELERANEITQAQLHILLLDCSDRTRRERLEGRNWAAVRIDEACEDARELRETVDFRLSTDEHPPSQLAREIVNWMRTTLP